MCKLCAYMHVWNTIDKLQKVEQIELNITKHFFHCSSSQSPDLPVNGHFIVSMLEKSRQADEFKLDCIKQFLLASEDSEV